MDRSFKRFLLFIICLVAITGGYVWGRSMGSSAPFRRHGLRDLSKMLSASASGPSGESDPAITHDTASKIPPDEVFEVVLEHVQREYVAANVDSNQKLSDGALGRMFASLGDLRTTFLEPELCKSIQSELKGHFEGIGAKLVVIKALKEDVEYHQLTILDVMPGSPAERAGLKSGDRITEVNGHWIIAYSPRVDLIRLEKKHLPDAELNTEFNKLQTKFVKGYTLGKALPYLVSGTGKTLSLTVERPGQPASFKTDIVTSETIVDPVDFQIVKNRVGMLKIRQFNPKATEEFQEVIKKFPSDLKGLILDLRSNPGGERADPKLGIDGYDSAMKLIGALSKGGNVATIEHRPNVKEPLVVKSSRTALNLPLIVLVDHGTANISELVASALHDVGRATIIGNHTFGDSILQLFTLLKNGSGVELAHAKMFTSAGIDLEKGLQPDLMVPEMPGDLAVQKALSVLGG